MILTILVPKTFIVLNELNVYYSFIHFPNYGVVCVFMVLVWHIIDYVLLILRSLKETSPAVGEVPKY